MGGGGIGIGGTMVGGQDKRNDDRNYYKIWHDLVTDSITKPIRDSSIGEGVRANSS